MRLSLATTRLTAWRGERHRVGLPKLGVYEVRRRYRARQALLIGALVYMVLHLGLASTASWSRWLRDPVYADKERKWQKLIRRLPEARPRILFLGTSRVANGFAAGEAQQRLGELTGRPVTVFNWGLPGAGPVTQYIHFRRLIKNPAKVDLLLLEVFPALMTEAGGLPVEAHFTEAIPWDDSELPILESYGFPVVSWRQERRNFWVAPWWTFRLRLMGRLAPSWLPYHQRYDWSRGPDPWGWSPIIDEDTSAERRAHRVERARQEYEHRLRYWQLCPVTEHALRDLLSFAQQHEVKVRIIWTPEAPSFQKHYSPQSKKRIEQWLHNLTKETGVPLVDCRDWMTEEAFSDGHHLLPTGAVRWTIRLTEEVLLKAITE
jgi:hypothetical protein